MVNKYSPENIYRDDIARGEHTFGNIFPPTRLEEAWNRLTGIFRRPDKSKAEEPDKPTKKKKTAWYNQGR